MNILISAVALAAAQTAPAVIDHSQHSPARHAQQQGQHQNHAEMMKHCHEMMAKMHKSMHEGHGNQPMSQSDQHKGHSGQ